MNAPSFAAWRPIPGFPYLASGDGRIWSPRRRKCLATHRKVTGYAQATLRGPAGSKGGHVARFICMAFHGLPPEPHWHVDHIDGDRTNDSAENLRWLSPHENWSRRSFNPARGEDVAGSKLTSEAVQEIRATRRQTTALAARYGVSKTTIKMIRRRKAWAHV